MVLLKTPSPQRGDSQRSKNQPPKLADSTRRSRGNSPSERSNVSRGNSPSKATSSGSKNKSSNSWTSKRSESGSIERLSDGDRKIVASKHLLPEDNINVVVRVRPLNEKEIKAGDKFAVQFPGDGQIQCDTLPNSNEKTKLFSYNVVFEPIASQEDVLQYSGIKKLIDMGVEGFSCTVFCYGQTGSGKTHTLTGPPGLFDHVDHYSEDHGLVFRSFVYLFKILQERQGCNFVLKASFLEIYNEKIMDLLNLGSSKKSLPVRWSKKTRGFFVENLFTVECEELDDLLSVLEEGMKNRAVGAHNMNEHSSRSHTVLTVHIRSEQQMENGVFISKQGKINFVDLAGSEMTKKTNSEGKTLEEANNINKSLMVLGYCIASLSDSKRKNGHIPYRDSKLTKLLADSLAGNGVTLMIACVSPARSNLSETLNTLRYAARAKRIRTKPIVVMDPREALILSLKREVDALQMENDHLKSTLHIGNKTYIRKNAESKEDKRVAATPPQVDLDKLAELDNPELSQLVQAYLIENEALRRENAELYATRDQIIRDQELVCRENERLLKKLEDVNSVCCRSPIIPARPTYSAEMLSNLSNDDLPGATNVWTNPNSETELIRPTVKKVAGTVMPQKVLKELDKRIVGSFNNIAETYKDKSHHRRYNSWDNGNNSVESPDQNGSLIDISHSKKSAFRRTSTVPEEMTSKSGEMLSSHIPTSHSLDGTPDSLLSGPLMEGPISAPNTGDSVAPTTPFPPISRSTSPVIIKKEDRVVHKVFGSPVPIDRDDF
ncbi:kinesin-like protein KIF12 [Chelonus insularis]|uniref:kinesin-like protein KIF12 n=1 Tax=Chelonus insularis TaxID=460826 RepID=UPI00158AD808|nr:kinesin-like protein KIF12 [Chelonus insularis]XP_034942204.1 kinesin-like protein KIF12 [Chelonus insularis]XP_034942205.1 kinesin-like protein KIF12 [Chelonus insularis]